MESMANLVKLVGVAIFCLVLYALYNLTNLIFYKETRHVTCESQGEVFESRHYNEDKKQVIIQCVR